MVSKTAGRLEIGIKEHRAVILDGMKAVTRAITAG